jgi:tetratricopeptide (TPR) repeat protein
LARELLASCLVSNGQIGEAESLTKDLAALYPEEPYPYVLLSRIMLMQGKVQEAVEFCNNALHLDDKYVPAIIGRAHLYIAEEEPVAASVSFEKLLLFGDPMLSSTAMEGLAYVDFLSGEFDDAGDDMDEAIRLAMSVGSTRRALRCGFDMINYLCELGRTDAAKRVLDRWMTRHGEIPAKLGELRIRVSDGEHLNVREALKQIRKDESWRLWMRSLSMDIENMRALTFIAERQFENAVNLLNSDSARPLDAQRSYLRGFASFQEGSAEQAADFFGETRSRLNSLEFPYHADPILHVQSSFYLAEAAIARGDAEEAKKHYAKFLDWWGDADWELRAVTRAREKLQTLSTDSSGG